MITIGKHPSTLVHGDGYPASFYIGDKMVAGYEEKTVTGDGVAGTETQYNGNIPSAVIQGIGRQKTIAGNQLLSLTEPLEQNAGGCVVTENSVTVPPNPWAGNYVYLRAKYPPGEYTVSGKEKLVYSNRFMVRGYDEKGNIVEPTVNFGGRTGQYIPTYKGVMIQGTNVEEVDYRTFTVSGCALFQFGFGAPSDYEQVIENPMLVKGSSPMPFEPYCGGIPAPNPDYPIEPEFLSTSQVSAKGKNICPNRFEFGYIAADTGIGNKTPDRHSYVFTPDYIPVEGNVVYKMTNGVKNRYQKVRFYDYNKNYIGYTCKSGSLLWSVGETNPVKTCTFVDNAAFLRFELDFDTDKEGEAVFAGNHPFQLEKGSTATPFTPYFDGGTVDVPVLRAIPETPWFDEYNPQTGVLKRVIKELTLADVKKHNIGLNAEYQEYASAYLSTSSFGIENSAEHQYMCSILPSGGWYGTNSRPGMEKRPGMYFWKAGASFGWRIHKSLLDPNYDSLSSDEKSKSFVRFFEKQEAEGRPLRMWVALAEPIIEQYDPAKLKQHPGYTQLIQQGGFAPAPVKGTFNVKKE